MAITAQEVQVGARVRHILPVSGKDSLATAIVQQTRQPKLQYELLYNDTYSELPEVDVWLKKVEAYFGLPITRVGASLEDIIYEQGILPSANARYCTRMSKIYPMEDYIGLDAAYVYYGLRADSSARIGYQANPKLSITPVYPLREMGITLPMVWDILEQRDLLPPQFFWDEVYERVMKHLGPIAQDFIANLLPWEKALLFAWRTRANCYHCFYQRVYEWIGLLCYHPDLYWHAAEIEETVGIDTGKQQRVKMFTWRQNESLRDLAKRKEEIIEKRVKQICSLITAKAQVQLFPVDEEDGLSMTSCGLFCGK